MDTAKVWSSFVAIMVPPGVNQSLVDILEKNCSPKVPACLPHVTILDPFLEPKQYDTAVAQLRANLEKVAPFTITLTEFGYFSKKKGSILWVKPVSQPPEALENLMKACLSVFPFCDEVTKISKEGYRPHDEAPNQCKILAPGFKPIQFQVKEVNFLFREGKQPYQIRRTVALGTEVSKPHFVNVPFSWEIAGTEAHDKDKEEKV